ncbi:hypothetical protein WR25_21258 [Diploscapter pachys]|uniref:Kelch repeat protein n=1 Tax=Diploscapter pachys TaxID=2018661 RepID=A0A2A2JDD9_9BILA|nr:hypothetical protein WR25_21258 [Diploscapter pachys]
MFDLNTRQITRGPDPPERRSGASVAYYKDKLYYLGGWSPKTRNSNRVDMDSGNQDLLFLFQLVLPKQ